MGPAGESPDLNKCIHPEISKLYQTSAWFRRLHVIFQIGKRLRDGTYRRARKEQASIMSKEVGDWKDNPDNQSPAEQLPEELSPEDRIIEVIDNALTKVSTKIETDGLKIADLVKLLQLRNELAKSKPRYMSIRWVDECDEQTRSND
jgi:hypothetical protein